MPKKTIPGVNPKTGYYRDLWLEKDVDSATKRAHTLVAKTDAAFGPIRINSGMRERLRHRSVCKLELKTIDKALATLNDRRAELEREAEKLDRLFERADHEMDEALADEVHRARTSVQKTAHKLTARVREARVLRGWTRRSCKIKK